jgi:hypothetical protein
MTQTIAAAILLALSFGAVAIEVAGMNSAPPVAVEGVR